MFKRKSRVNPPQGKEKCHISFELLPGKTYLSNNLKYIYRLYEEDELYDLEKDPQELDNRINDPAYGEAVLKMKSRMLDFMVETGDLVPDRKDIR